MKSVRVFTMHLRYGSTWYSMDYLQTSHGRLITSSVVRDTLSSDTSDTSDTISDVLCVAGYRTVEIDKIQFSKENYIIFLMTKTIWYSRSTE